MMSLVHTYWMYSGARILSISPMLIVYTGMFVKRNVMKDLSAYVTSEYTASFSGPKYNP